MQRGKFEVNKEQYFLDAKSQGLEFQLEDELYSFSKLLKNNYDFKLFLEDPRVSADYKKNMLGKLCHKSISHYFLSITHMLIDNGREELVEDISNSFTKRLSKEEGVVFGEVLSVLNLPDKQKKRLESAMSKIKKKPVKLRYSVDASPLGGLIVKFISGEVWDVSLMHKLEELKSAVLA